ncbi:SGNH/GDSL hydrolase family protein [Micromonospora sp. NPDC023956]|uniref:SGNH/GDSL hydrolase family protein n=1 Tax=Micromonospora sp. NPDC023956 TaxID=3155722 RepID=UPI0033D5FB31
MMSHRTLLASIAAVAAATLLAPSAAVAAVPTSARMVALGDSITRAAVADGTRDAQPQNSWSTGTSTAVQSHLRRLEAYGVDMTGGNYARGGDRSTHLATQATNALAAADADYVTILVGGNDICYASTPSGTTSPDTFEANVRRSLDIIRAKNPDTRVMLASVPSMMSLYRIGRDNVLIRARWSLIGICPVMLANPTDTSSAANERRAAVEARVDGYNQRLAKLAAERGNVFYDNGAVHDTPFTSSDLSILDGFHPSLSGQNKIAQVTWNEAVRQGVFDVD